jgi:hypothetical protein
VHSVVLPCSSVIKTPLLTNVRMLPIDGTKSVSRRFHCNVTGLIAFAVRAPTKTNRRQPPRSPDQIAIA